MRKAAGAFCFSVGKITQNLKINASMAILARVYFYRYYYRHIYIKVNRKSYNKQYRKKYKTIEKVIDKIDYL